MASTKHQVIFHRPSLSRLLQYLVLLAVCGMMTLSGYIYVSLRPMFENGRVFSQVMSIETFATQERDDMFAPQEDSGNIWKKNDNFRDRYKNMYDLKSMTVGIDYVNDEKKFLIYRCDTDKMSGCSNWADLVKGVEAAYLIANLTGRVYKVEIYGFPCKLTDYVSPSFVNWTLNNTFHEVLNKGMAGVSIRNFDNNPSFYNNLDKLELLDIVQENFEYVYFKSNLDCVPVFKNSKEHSAELSWMRTLGTDAIHAILYKRLFVPAPRMMKRLELFLFSILPSSDHRLICVDFGTSKYGDILGKQINYLSNLWSFIRTESTTDIDKVFINTDSQEILSQARAETFRSRLVTSPQVRLPNGQSEQLGSACKNIEVDIFHQHVMVNCDVLVVSTSDVGRLAAYLRGTDSGLYCLMGNGHVHPCRASRLDELYRTHG